MKKVRMRVGRFAGQVVEVTDQAADNFVMKGAAELIPVEVKPVGLEDDAGDVPDDQENPEAI